MSNKSKEGTFSLAWRLCVICAAAALVLAGVFLLTKAPIASAEAEARSAAMRTVLPDAAEFTPLEKTSDKDDYAIITEVAEGTAGDGICGYVVSVSTKGYNSGLELAIGIDADGTVSGVVITASEETPGLGAKASDPEFLAQFAGVRNEVTEFDAISGATKTSTAVKKAVDTALTYYGEVLAGGNA